MLYLVATPIGNLGDITLRALEILHAVDVVASEDTRKTGLLLKRYGIKRPQVSFWAQNEERAGQRILTLLQAGQDVALVSNAGTPGISDPGFTLVRRVVDAGIAVTALPGPNAAIAALILSGLPCDSFTFRGFPPRKPGGRRRFLAADRELPYTLIYYESPYRIRAFLEDAILTMGDRRAALANDLTKLFERVERGQLSQLLETVTTGDLKGEFVVVIAGRDD